MLSYSCFKTLQCTVDETKSHPTVEEITCSLEKIGIHGQNINRHFNGKDVIINSQLPGKGDWNLLFKKSILFCCKHLDKFV